MNETRSQFKHILHGKRTYRTLNALFSWSMQWALAPLNIMENNEKNKKKKTYCETIIVINDIWRESTYFNLIRLENRIGRFFWTEFFPRISTHKQRMLNFAYAGWRSRRFFIFVSSLSEKPNYKAIKHMIQNDVRQSQRNVKCIHHFVDGAL